MKTQTNVETEKITAQNIVKRWKAARQIILLFMKGKSKDQALVKKAISESKTLLKLIIEKKEFWTTTFLLSLKWTKTMTSLCNQ